MRIKDMAKLAILAFVIPSLSYAADQSTPLPRCGQTAFDLCGYIDAEIWEKEDRTVFVIEPKFENAKRFSEGLAAVRIEGKFGYIDTTGEIVITPKFDQAGMFDQGLSVAGGPTAVGIIDRSGEYVVEPSFKQAIIFSD